MNATAVTAPTQIAADYTITINVDIGTFPSNGGKITNYSMSLASVDPSLPSGVFSFSPPKGGVDLQAWKEKDGSYVPAVGKVIALTFHLTDSNYSFTSFDDTGLQAGPDEPFRF